MSSLRGLNFTFVRRSSRPSHCSITQRVKQTCFCWLDFCSIQSGRWSNLCPLKCKVVQRCTPGSNFPVRYRAKQHSFRRPSSRKTPAHTYRQPAGKTWFHWNLHARKQSQEPVSLCAGRSGWVNLLSWAKSPLSSCTRTLTSSLLLPFCKKPANLWRTLQTPAALLRSTCMCTR